MFASSMYFFQLPLGPLDYCYNVQLTLHGSPLASFPRPSDFVSKSSATAAAAAPAAAAGPIHQIVWQDKTHSRTTKNVTSHCMQPFILRMFNKNYSM
jgi:hypothetical protein